MAMFFEELRKLGSLQPRAPGSWTPTTVGAPRSKLPSQQAPRSPTVPGNMSTKIVGPASKFGPQQNYSEPNTVAPPELNPTQAAAGRNVMPPNVVYGVR